MELKVDHKTVRALIDSDPEFEVKLKTNILRTACQGMAKQTLDGAVLDAINSAIATQFGKFEKQGYSRVFVPSQALMSVIDKIMSEQPTKTIEAEVKKAYKKTDVALGVKVDHMVQTIDAKIKRSLDEALIERIIDNLLTKKLQTIVDGMK